MAKNKNKAAITARQLVDEYLAHQIVREVTRVSTRGHLKQVLAMYGGWQARRVGPEQMREFLADQRTKGVMDSTATHRAKLWRTVLLWGVSNGYLPESPLAGFKLRQVRARRIEPPTRAEAERMYRVAAPHVQRVIVIGMAAGPRIGPSELFRLRWEDVDLEAACMRMPNAYKGAEEESRIVPIRDDILPLLREWQQTDAEQGYQWVIHWHGKQVRHIGHAWHKAREAAGITRRISPYSLRHAMPTDALEHGADPKAVAEVMGHADVTMILDTYQSVRYRLKVRAVNAAPGLRLGSKKR